MCFAVERKCSYRVNTPPGNLSELYTVQWRFRERGNDIVIVPPGFGPNNLPFDNLPIAHILSIDEDTFALTVAVEQTGNQFHCDVNVRRNDIGFATVRYIGATIELIVRGEFQVKVMVVSFPFFLPPKGMSYQNETSPCTVKKELPY